MADNTARRDAWRDAQHATTVTGERVRPGDAPRESDHAPHGNEATDPANAAPGHPALTNVGTIYDSDAGGPVGAVTND